jgi:hypothetical protein
MNCGIGGGIAGVGPTWTCIAEGGKGPGAPRPEGFNRDCFVGTSSRIPIPATTSTAWQSGLRRATTEALGFPTLCRSERLRAILVAHLTVPNVQLALDQILHWAFCW